MSSDEDIQAVRTLNMDAGDNFDKSRDFSSLSALKISKKDRHNRTLYDFSKFVEATNETVVQEVLLLSREFRETMEVTDAELRKFCANIDQDSFLIPRSEKDLIGSLQELKRNIQSRSDIVEKFGFDLDNTETKRAEIMGAELKRLVDKLIAIAHQLPDDIEHIVEAEAFELNTEIISNKAVHAQTVAEHQIKQIQFESELLQNWEDTRVKWRNLRHEKALNDFREHVASEEFTDPMDRQIFMKEYRISQSQRQERLQQLLQRLATLHNGNINCDEVMQVQAELVEQNEIEMQAIQSCYDGLADLRSGLAYFAQDRVEALRRELHVYGALKVEPDRDALASSMQSALDDESLSELWRLGGGLKSEFQSHISDVRSDDVIYERVVLSMENRLKMIICSFDLKQILEKRGRLAQLDKMRGLITKMRTAPRAEVADVLRAMIPDLQSVDEIEQLSELFKTTVAEVVTEISEELESVERRIAASNAGSVSSGISNAISESRSQSATSLVSGATGRVTSGSVKSGKTGRTGMTSDAPSGGGTNIICPDPNLVKNWNRRLGILYYGSDLPLQHQETCYRGLELTLEQRECNNLVDAVVSDESVDKLRRIDRMYEKSNEYIATYSETQATQLFYCTTNIGEFFLRTAKMVEAHRAEQKNLDEKSADEVWDLKEEFRLASEDREELYQAACQKIRESTKQEELEEHFKEVLDILETIQQSYRDYHSDACFAADRYPLMLMHDFRGYLDRVCENFFLRPDPSHPIVLEYGRVFDQVIRFNRKFFEGEKGELAAGMKRIEEPSSAEPPKARFPNGSTNQTVVAGTDLSDNSTASAEVEPIELLSPFIRDGQEAPPDANCGRFSWTYTEMVVERRFREEAAFTSTSAADAEVVSEENKPFSSQDPATQEISDDTVEMNAPKSSLVLKKEPHPDYPYIVADSLVLPLAVDELEQLHPEDRDDYELNILKYFIPLEAEGDDDNELPAVVADMTEDQLRIYRDTLCVYNDAKRRREEQSSADYICKHPPLDPKATPWVLQTDIEGAQILSLMSGIRDSIISNLEQSSLKRTVAAERVSETSKKELTDELEDRIRNHWPRRGRVETQIKQPREVELLSHKEKTWRHITSIQQKMIQAQEHFEELKMQCKKEIELYEQQMHEQTESLQADFNNLAALQGIDVKTRGTTQEFQSRFTRIISEMQSLFGDGIESIIFFARDFRKICPPQAPGVEGGYSVSEIAEIEALVEGQCQEIVTIAAEWKEDVMLLEDQQITSLQLQNSFMEKYKQRTQDVAMAEGLGQKYGAPRRRAQERIRTEISRDEARAGRIDTLLAHLEFECSEALRRTKHGVDAGADESQSTASLFPERSAVTFNESGFTNGEQKMFDANIDWNRLVQLRLALHQRVKYLRINEGPLLELLPLKWLPDERLELCANVGSMENSKQELERLENDEPTAALEEFFEDVDKTCRKETRQLYEAEGLQDALGEAGIPDSLQHWLSESRDKILGRHGYRERAWKRFWLQVQRCEDALARHLVPAQSEDAAGVSPVGEDAQSHEDGKSASKYSTRLGIPAITLRMLADSFIDFAQQDKRKRVAEFARLLKIWDKAREKHERLLRPRLGAPDMAEELDELNTAELQRSSEVVENIHKFRSQCIRSQTKFMLQLVEDVSLCSQGLMSLLDSTVRQELLQVPPDTEIPKKHLTLKKLRKAQRVREQVAQGGEDRSQRRTWAGIDSQFPATVLRSAENMVTDLGSDPQDTAPDPRAPEPPAAGVKGKSSKSDKNAPPQEPVKASLVPAAWEQRMKEESALQGLVSTAHRIVISERDNAIHRFTQHIAACFEDIRSDYDMLLRQETSWNERWQRQVQMLREGGL